MNSSDDFADEIRDVVTMLKAHGVLFEDGLSASEIQHVERRFGFHFPPDLKAFLQSALPVGITSGENPAEFPNWRAGDHFELWRRMNWPCDGIAFDVEHNHFWLPQWGQKPERMADALHIARQAVHTAPRLIPIYSHRYMPAEPPLAGNPVLSIHQTDVIYYGRNLWAYFRNEFGGGNVSEGSQSQSNKQQPDAQPPDSIRPIRFWSALAQ